MDGLKAIPAGACRGSVPQGLAPTSLVPTDDAPATRVALGFSWRAHTRWS